MPASHPVRQLPFLAPGSSWLRESRLESPVSILLLQPYRHAGFPAMQRSAPSSMRRVTENNYVPPALADEYATAVLTEYKKATEKSHGLP